MILISNLYFYRPRSRLIKKPKKHLNWLHVSTDNQQHIFAIPCQANANRRQKRKQLKEV